jgi:arginase
LIPSRVVIAGARDLDAPERAFIDSSGTGLVEGWPDDVAARLIAALRAGDVTQLYIHVDVDLFDPDDFGDALFTVPGGPSPGSVAATIRELADAFDVVGVGVVESCGRVPGSAAALVGFLTDSMLWPPAQRGSEAVGER